MPIDWKYYIIEHAFVVRADLREMYAERLMRDGRWVEFPDLRDITYNGRQVADEAEAMAAARELFAMYPELP
jgi:hypothetical protein